MDIEICKWYNNADSPVLFMIDDFANVWVDTNGNGEIDIEEDWGYGKNSEKSSFRYLNEVILKDFPKVKVTFFTPVGIRVGIIEDPPIKSVSKMINCDDETKEFFRNIYNNSKFEIAYHGTTHGKVGKTRHDFKQEWELFQSLEEANEVVNYGKEIYKDVFGDYPKGGKYCGYCSNCFSDDSIDKGGFLWWCRYCNLDTKNAIKNGCLDKFFHGEDCSDITNFDAKKFGINEVIDIPSTVNGGLLSGIIKSNCNSLKGIAKIILKKYLVKKKLEQIDYLVKNKLVISIQEHISPARDDGRRQQPNIYDDRESLRMIFKFLNDKKIWYCTGSELAEYVYLKNAVKLISNSEKVFFFEFNINKVINGREITLKINDNRRSYLIAPNGEYLKIKNGIVNVPLLQGEYELN